MKFIPTPFMLLLAACAAAGPAGPGPDQVPPPHTDSEDLIVLETPAGRAAARLVAEPEEIDPTDRVVVRVENRGELVLAYGRPLMVERWDGREWVETDESRESAWTMELIMTAPGERGLEQRWPFREGRRPESGWYRFTKQVQAEVPSADPERMVLRTRVLVVQP